MTTKHPGIWEELGLQPWTGLALLPRVSSGGWHDHRGYTPLMAAAASGMKDAAVQLLAQGVEVDAVDVDNESALTQAIRHGHVDIAYLLYKAGASLGRTNRYGQTLVQIAVAGVDAHTPLPSSTLHRLQRVLEFLMRENTPLTEFSSQEEVFWKDLTHRAPALACFLQGLLAHQEGVLLEAGLARALGEEKGVRL